MRYWILALVFLAGCSASKKIADSAVQITTDAAGIRTEVVQAKQNLEAKNLPAVDKNLDVIDGHAVSITKETGVIQRELTQVQDKVAYWQTMLKWIGIGLAAVAVLFLMWRLNLFLAFEKIGQGIVTFIAKVMGA